MLSPEEKNSNDNSCSLQQGSNFILSTLQIMGKPPLSLNYLSKQQQKPYHI